MKKYLPFTTNDSFAPKRKAMDAIFIIDIIGTFVFALSGVMAAIDREFDLFGTMIMAFVTAVGGGTLRDILIGDTPVGWMSSDVHIWVILSTIPLAFFFLSALRRLRKTFWLFDTLGIGLFTILGMEKSLQMGLSPLIAIMMGVVSAVFWGIIRDVLSSKVPLIFQKEIYAFACFLGAVVYLGLDHISSWPPLNLWVSICVVILVRLLAIYYKWSIPFNPLGKR